MRVPFNSMDRNSLILMDELWQKNGKAKKAKSNPLDDILEPALPKGMQLKPDWNRIPSKNEAVMTEEEFEEAIRALALKDAERGMKLGSSSKGKLGGEAEYNKLRNAYISVASPDRKAAYEKFNGKGDTVYGNFNQKLLTRGQDGVWQYSFTKEETARASKFGTIYINTIKEFEAEHGKIPYDDTATVVRNPYSQWAKANPSAYPSIYNVLA